MKLTTGGVAVKSDPYRFNRHWPWQMIRVHGIPDDCYNPSAALESTQRRFNTLAGVAQC